MKRNEENKGSFREAVQKEGERGVAESSLRRAPVKTKKNKKKMGGNWRLLSFGELQEEKRTKNRERLLGKEKKTEEEPL